MNTMRENLFVPATTCLVLLITFTILLTAGCTDSAPGQQGQVTIAHETQPENPDAAITVRIRTTTAPVPQETSAHAPATQKTKGPAPATGSSDGVILLDPIGDVYDGQEYLITGTTSLPVGTELLLQLMPDTGIPPNGTDKNAIGGSSSGTASITKGDGTSNRIRMEGSMGGQPSGKWVALLGEMKGSYSDFQVGDHYGYAYFTLK
jgi:hypothetical protein